MTRPFSRLIALGCSVALIVAPLAALYFLINIEQFAAVAKINLPLAIYWQTVTDLQWYGLWLLTLLYWSVGLAGLYFLRRAFSSFANGELFNHRNSQDLRGFAILLFVQAAAKPLHFSLASLLLSMNHPVGQKVLSISLGSNEIKVIALAMILWVMSDLLVGACKLENENKQFI